MLQLHWRSQHVLTEDTLERHIKDGKLYSKRLLSKTNHVPKWGRHFYDAKSVKIVEESICDPKTKTLTTYTRNVAFTKVMVNLIQYRLWYPKPKNTNQCILHSFDCRAWSKKSFTKHPMNILKKQLQYVRRGSIHKSLGFREQYEHLDVNGLRKIVTKWWVVDELIELVQSVSMPFNLHKQFLNRTGDGI